ncbi:MAG: archaemetzincin [Planctomycetota bacterium]
MKRVVLLLVVLVLAAGTWWLQRFVQRSGLELERVLLEEQLSGLERRRQAVWGRYDEKGFERLGRPQPGEWLARSPEQGQTLEEYVKGCANRRREGREAIVLRPLGPLSPRARAALDPVRRFTEAYFASPVRLLDEAPLPDAAYSKERGQHDVTPLLVHLKSEVKEDELIRAGIADRDLSWTALVPNFVFGGASIDQRVGVYSLARFAAGDPSEKLYRTRAFKLLAHELGHVLSLAHCIYYRCVMNGVNSLVESDAAPLRPCPVCFEKLRWNLGLDPDARARALAKFYADEQLDEKP